MKVPDARLESPFVDRIKDGVELDGRSMDDNDKIPVPLDKIEGPPVPIAQEILAYNTGM